MHVEITLIGQLDRQTLCIRIFYVFSQPKVFAAQQTVIVDFKVRITTEIRNISPQTLNN